MIAVTEKHPLAASMLIHRKPDNKVLAVSRRNRPDVFGLCGGKLDPGETFMEAAVRETLEETGVQVLEQELVFIDLCEGETVYKTATFIAKDWEGEPRSMDSEMVVAWVSPKKIIEGCFGTYNKKLFDKLGIDYSNE